jgi:hypothetical protein
MRDPERELRTRHLPTLPAHPSLRSASPRPRRSLRAAKPPCARVVLVTLGAIVAIVGASGAAQAQLRTCVEIEAPARERDTLDRLVRSELDRHPSHRATTGECQGTLTVEVLDLGARDGRWLTGRINSQVPHREKVGADGLVPTVERLLAVVLHNDPLVLVAPGSQNWLERQRRALEVRSAMHWGVELYELATPVGATLESVPGFALTVRREASALYIGARLAGAFDPGGAPERLRLRAQVDAQLEAGFYASPAAGVSFFASALLGLVNQRLEGPAPLDGTGATGSTTATGLSLAARAGVEALRTSDVRVLAFFQLAAPTFVSRDPDHGIVDQWLPNVSLGAGLLF